MAFGVKYRLDFDDINVNTTSWRVDILQDSYVGSIIEHKKDESRGVEHAADDQPQQ